MPGTESDPDLVPLRREVNRSLEPTDAGRPGVGGIPGGRPAKVHRQLLLTGVPGVFRRGARTVDGARRAMTAAAARAQEGSDARLADELASTVLCFSLSGSVALPVREAKAPEGRWAGSSGPRSRPGRR